MTGLQRVQLAIVSIIVVTACVVMAWPAVAR
jgi:hypothetical protein